MSAKPSPWSNYGFEALALGLFMVSASVITVVVEHPGSPVRAAVTSDIARRLLTGIGMGLTAICLIYSPFGRRSGAHMNPAVTFTYLRLGKVTRRDAAGYVAAQFAGALAGLTLAAAVLRSALADPAVSFIATRPGPAGLLAAFGAELVISAGVMSLVLFASNSPRLMQYTGLLVGGLIAAYITFEAPLSGMSMNPARTFAPRLVGGVPTPLWIYFAAPPLGMLAASELFVRLRGRAGVYCAKLQHPETGDCMFACRYGVLRELRERSSSRA